MNDAKANKRKSLRLMSPGKEFHGRSEELKELREAFLEKGSRAVAIYGEAGIGKTSLAVKLAESLPEEFDYCYSFECRGGIKAEEVVFRLCQFLDYHDIGSFQNIILSPIPLELKTEFLSKFLSRTKLLLIFDDLDTSIAPEHGQLSIADPALKDFLSSLIRQCGEGARFMFTSTSRFELPVEDMSHIELGPLEGNSPHETRLRAFIDKRGLAADKADSHLLTAVIDSLEESTKEALKKLSPFEKAVPLIAITDNPDETADLMESGLAGGFAAGGQDMIVMHSLAREHMRTALPKSEWKELIHKAAAFREAYGRDNGIIWHMIYAHDLYVEAMDFEKAAEIASFVSPTLLGWGQIGLAYEMNMTSVGSVEGALKARALYTAGSIEVGRSEYEKAMKTLHESLSIFESLSDEAGVSDALIQIATIHNNRGDLDEAVDLYERALILKEARRDMDNVSLILNRLAQIYQDRGQEEKALETYKRSADQASGSGVGNSELMALEKMGGLHASRGEIEEAIVAYEKGMDILEPLKDPSAMTRALNRLGGLYFKKGEAGKALEHLKRSLKYSEITRSKELSAINLLEMGRVYFELKDYMAAIKNTVIALALFDTSSSESKSAAIEMLSHMEKEIGQEEFARINEEVMKELREKGPTPG
ncbi:tetratricopeptide repeat protein [Nitrospirota bacterium]